jgi:hypothetical protein
MKLHELKPAKGATKPRKRKGRGVGSGLGKTPAAAARARTRVQAEAFVRDTKADRCPCTGGCPSADLPTSSKKRWL